MMAKVYMTAKRILCGCVAMVLILGVFPCVASNAYATEKEDTQTVYQRMLARAEAIVNFTWVPTKRIATWNENPYNGKNYFEAGETVVGMPYTMFSWELGIDSLLSLEQYKKVAAENYDATTYCNSIGAERTGPVYGSCCATFVSEIFGGDFMVGSNPRHDNVYGIVNSGFATTYYNVVATDIQSGDALSNPEGSHILWVGEITDTYLTIYEQTPPVARKQTVSRTSIDENGYLVYGDHIYNIVTRSNELIQETASEQFPTYEIDDRYPTPFKAYNLANTKTAAYNSVAGFNVGYIYATDECTIYEVYTNGWCKLLCPWTGYSDGRIVYAELSAFLDTDYTPTTTTVSSQTTTYTRSDSATSYGYIGAGDTVTLVGESGAYSQVIYPLSSGGYKCAWALLSSNATVVDYPVPFKCRTISTDKVVCYNSIGGTSPGKIYPEDDCVITAVYDNGWVQCICPWSGGTTKTVYVEKSVFIDSADEPIMMIAPNYALTYLRADMSESIGWIDVGDEITIVATSGDKTQIIYPADVGKRCAWVYTSDLMHSYTISYNANGGEGAPSSQTKFHGESLELSSEIPTRAGYVFRGWATDAMALSAEYQPGDSFDLDADTILYAVWEVEIITLTKIEVATKPTKTVYEIGESLDTTGLALKATYGDGSTKTITSGFTTSGFDSSAAGEKTVVISYGGKTTTFTVTVEECIEVDPDAPQIVVESVTATAGDTVSVVVKIVNNPGFGGMAYDVYYDNTVLELVSYELDLGNSICTDSGLDTYPDRVNFQYAGTANVAGDGTLVIFTFTVKDTAEMGMTAITVIPEDGTVFRYDGRTEVDFDLVAVNGGVEVINYIKGDINGDGKVNNRDAARLMQHLAGWDVEYVEAALDVNGDGKVNNRDAARLLQYLAGWEVVIY